MKKKDPRTPGEVWEVLERIGKVWQEFPELSLGSLVYQVARNPTELYVLKDKELVKRIEELLTKEVEGV